MFHKPFVYFAVFLSLVLSVNGQDCNICGDNNSIQYGTGVVEFMYNGAKWKNSCLELEKTVQNVIAISDEFCRTELLQYTKDVCRCTTPDGDLLSDLPSPTIAPTPSSVFVKAPTPTVTNTSPTSIQKHDTSSSVKVKCEQESGNAKDCTDTVNDTSSAVVNKCFVCGTFWTVVGVFSIFIAL
jgi:hypothetical protein